MDVSHMAQAKLGKIERNRYIERRVNGICNKNGKYDPNNTETQLSRIGRAIIKYCQPPCAHRGSMSVVVLESTDM